MLTPIFASEASIMPLTWIICLVVLYCLSHGTATYLWSTRDRHRDSSATWKFYHHTGSAFMLTAILAIAVAIIMGVRLLGLTLINSF